MREERKMELNLIKDGKAIPILVEAAGLEGVRRIGSTVAEDICLVTGMRPEVMDGEQLKESGALMKRSVR